jgi:hypothetical protein
VSPNPHIGPVSQDQHSGDSQETISHQTDLELQTPMHTGILLRYMYLQGYYQEETNYVVDGFTETKITPLLGMVECGLGCLKLKVCPSSSCIPTYG